MDTVHEAIIELPLIRLQQLLTGDVTLAPLPKGTRVIAAHVDFAAHSVLLKVEHQSLPCAQADGYRLTYPMTWQERDEVEGYAPPPLRTRG